MHGVVMKNKVIKFPISRSNCHKNKMGNGYVPCMVSDRWIQFPKKSAGHFEGGEFIEISIMTHSYTKDEPRKLCDMIVTREDLLRAINAITEPDKETSD